MFKKNILKKTNGILLIVFVLNLGLWMFFTPMQAQACLDKNGETTTNCHSCNPAGECVSDPDGPYWCAQCFGKCGSTSSGSSGSSGTTNVNVVSMPKPPCASVDPTDFFGTISTLYDGTEMAENTKQEIINMILNDEEIPETLKSYIISSIQKDGNITDAVKNELISIIQDNGVIPESLKSILISAINGNSDIEGLIKNWVLDLLLKHVDIEHICKSFSDIAANMMIWGTSIGTPIAIAISQLCPIILNEILQTFLQTLPEPAAPANIQTIQYPIFESYQWEIGIPGFTSPGEITPFK